MPDTRPPEAASAPLEDWGQALTALPLESPPDGSWQRIAAQLPRKRSSARIWVPAALAASLALLLVAPWKAQPPATPAANNVASTQTTPQPVPQAPADVTALPSATAQVAVAANEPAISEPSRVTPAGPEKAAAGNDRQAEAQRRQVAAQTDATVSTPPASVNKEGVTSERLAAGPQPADVTTADVPSPPSQEDLYAESARLEALLSQIRDERVSSGTAMALSAELHERIGGIDAALSQPELDANERLTLWRERVATLQRLTGVESTQRWMAANGYRADGQVAQVY